MPRPDVRKPLVIFSAGVVALFAVWYFFIAGESGTTTTMGSVSPRPQGQKYEFETVKGFFMQDDPNTDHKTFDYESSNFGIIQRKYDTDGPDDAALTHWERFEKYVRHLNETSPAGTVYKVIYNGRHGEGYHNLGERKYGTPAWDAYWSKLDGDGELYWFDARLTDRGQSQAQHNNAFLKRQFSKAKMPTPEKHYSSPLYRCLQTANLTYSGLELPDDKPFHPLIKELMREVMGEHTCDKRSSKTVIRKAVPSWDIEPGFTEEDELWQAEHRETNAEHDARTQQLLDDIFEHDGHVFLSFTSHSGAIASLLRVLRHREFPLPTGALIPLFVKATRIA